MEVKKIIAKIKLMKIKILIVTLITKVKVIKKEKYFIILKKSKIDAFI
jgi:uncharacterized membrane protein